MGVEGVVRSARKAGVEVRDELGREGVGRVDGRYVAQPQFLHKPVLQRQIGALDATFGRRGIGANDVDIELAHGSPELGDAVSSTWLLGVDTEDSGLVAIKCHGLAELLDVAA